MKFITKLLTKNRTRIPLFFVTFDYQKFQQEGKVGSCMAKMHPLLKDDEYVKNTLNEIIDYVRDNYHMEQM